MGGLAIFSFDKRSYYYKSGINDYPLFYNLGFCLNKKRHTIDIGIAQQIADINFNSFYYSLSYSYKITSQNKIADLSTSVKAFSYLYQIQNPTNDAKQFTYIDMIACFGPTISKKINRLTFRLNAFYFVKLPLYIKKYKNGHVSTLNSDKVQYLPTSFLTELQVTFRLNKKPSS